MMGSCSEKLKTLIGFTVWTVVAAVAMSGFPRYAEGALRIGIVLPLSGQMATIGEQVSEAFRFAVEELRRNGNLKGDSLELIFADTGGDPAQARAAVAQLLSQDKVSALIGGIAGPATWEIARAAQRDQVPFLITTASADSLTRQGWDYVFRLSLPVQAQIGAFAGFIDNGTRGIRTAAVLHDDSRLGPYRSETLLRLWHARDIETILISGFPAFSGDFRPLLAKAKVKSPELVYLLFSREDAPLVLRQVKELRLNAKLIIGEAAGFGDPELFQKDADAAEYLCVLTQWTPNAPYPGVTDLAEAYRERYDRMPDYRTAQAYAGMQVIIDAVVRTGTPTPQNLRRALAKTSMATVYGRVNFESGNGLTNQNQPAMLVLQWIDQQQEIVWPRKLATKRLVFPNPKWRKR
ncbi:hypothetical protein D3OALGA1CA_2552 [Olavius algarvensis associated proteobacterium Delta 3]|nr:hypothetical protein D3OALGA1CA_2552 [Olavius algarvensis associated proteobacterium Delta 3]